MTKTREIETARELAAIEAEVAEAAEPDTSGHPIETARTFVQLRAQFLDQYRQALTLSEVYKRMKEPEVASRHAESAAKARTGLLAVEAAVGAAPPDIRQWYRVAIKAAAAELAAKADAARDALR